MVRALLQWVKLPAKDRLITAEAAVALALGAVTVAVIPFRHIVAYVEARQRSFSPAEAASERIVDLVRRAVERAAKGSFWRAKCFEQGLAAYWMLYRRGVATTLHYGISKGADESLVAHVWVRSDTIDVVGCDIAGDYAELIQFPRVLSEQLHHED
jgi:hypothetical protein